MKTAHVADVSVAHPAAECVVLTEPSAPFLALPSPIDLVKVSVPAANMAAEVTLCASSSLYSINHARRVGLRLLHALLNRILQTVLLPVATPAGLPCL